MKVSVDSDRCRGHGVCVALCPTVFELTDDGYATAPRGQVPAEHHAAVTDAENACPEYAIVIE
ncbi:ferredoxin [Nocardia sp. NPDC052254]|uniref:ferredoxin n=1 Tax=Nocardia sp. NPDC052254 TaxID=3155681 RepID=UPI00342CF97F